ncbi:hypothetical protein JKP88DRAFT_307302 [Tribonema minus]|uniref:Uncharacterized protein n=1 Tax=Tribonema minus TaxID=303371 RepID=A0A835Z9V4_9STRA|nr:hypothetical protein JKP88DRAFT_307302 [Tribonema minus]
MLRALLLCVLASTGTDAAVAAREGRTRGRRRAQRQLPHHTANDGALSLHAPAVQSDLDIPPDSSDSTTPTSLTDSTTPTSPTDSTTPTSPTDSTTPTSPTDSTTPTSPTDSTSDYTSDSSTPTSLSDDDAALPTPAVSPGPTTTTAATSPTSSYTYSDTPYFDDPPCGTSSSGSSGPCAPVAPVFCADAPAAPLCIDVVPGTLCLAGWLPVGLGGGEYGCVWAPNLTIIVALCPAVAGSPLPPGGCVAQPGGGGCGAGFALVAAAQQLCVPATKVVATAVPLPPPNGAVPTLPPSRPALPGAKQQPTVDVAPPRLQAAPVPVTAPSGANVKPQRPANLPPPPPPPAATPLPAGTDLGVIDAATAAVWKVQLSTGSTIKCSVAVAAINACLRPLPIGFFEQTFGASYSKDDGTLLVTAASSAPPGGSDAVGRVIALDPKAAAAAPPMRRLLASVANRRTPAGPVVWARELGGGRGLYSAAYAVYVTGKSVLAAGGARGVNIATRQLGTTAYAVQTTPPNRPSALARSRACAAQLSDQRGRVRRLTDVANAAAPIAGNELGFAVAAPSPDRRGADAAARRALGANEIAPVVGGTVDGAAFVTAYNAKGAAQWTAPGAKETTATVSLNVDADGKDAAGVIALQTTVWPSDARSADTGADALVVQRLDAATGAVVSAAQDWHGIVTLGMNFAREVLPVSYDIAADALVVQRLGAALGAVVWATKPQYNAVGTAVASSKQHRVTVVGYEGPNVLVKSYSYKTGKKVSWC